MRKSELESLKRPGGEGQGTIAGTIGGTIAGTIGGTIGTADREDSNNSPVLLRSLD